MSSVQLSITWPQALAWRMRRQFLDPIGEAPAAEVTRRLAGVQAQVASSAELSIALRQATRRPDEVQRALWQDGALMKTWAMRGTLHLLPSDEAAAYLALCATIRNWEKPAWERMTGAGPADMEKIAEVVAEVLADGGCLTRGELSAAVIDATGSVHLAEAFKSGWGAILKPLAWWGVLCYGPSRGTNVTFAAPARRLPGWRGVPPPQEAARTVIRAFLGAHGPATIAAFDNWLMRKQTPKKQLKSWFAAMEDELATVEVDGVAMYALPEHLEELRATGPVDTVRLLGGFDQYVLGAGTDATYLIPAERRAEVSRTAGWISPVVLRGGRVVGVWDAKAGPAETALFEKVPARRLKAEISRVSRVQGHDNPR